MSIFKKNPTIIELETKVLILRCALEQKDKEIAMWMERGNRLLASYTCTEQEREKAVETLRGHLEKQASRILDTLDKTIEFKTYKEAVQDQNPQTKDKK
jgi:hypothetical protein